MFWAVGGFLVGVICLVLAIPLFIDWLRKRDEIRNLKKKIEELEPRISHNLGKKFERILEEKFRNLPVYLNRVDQVTEPNKAKLLEEGLDAVKEYRHAEAIDKFKECYKLATDNSERCAILNLIGVSQRRSGATREAKETFLEMIRIAEKAKIDEALAAAYGNIGLVNQALGEPEKALEYYEKVLGIGEKIGSLEIQASVLGNIGSVYFTLGEPRKALEYHQRALKIDEKMGNLQGQAEDLNNMGAVYFDLWQFKEALSYFQRAREMFLKIGAKHLVEKAERGIALAKKAMGEGA